jgi:hypothetical protein
MIGRRDFSFAMAAGAATSLISTRGMAAPPPVKARNVVLSTACLPMGLPAVKWHVKRIFLKLEVRTRAEAVSRATALYLMRRGAERRVAPT